jgi:hypothetical protein
MKLEFEHSFRPRSSNIAANIAHPLHQLLQTTLQCAVATASSAAVSSAASCHRHPLCRCLCDSLQTIATRRFLEEQSAQTPWPQKSTSIEQPTSIRPKTGLIFESSLTDSGRAVKMWLAVQDACPIVGGGRGKQHSTAQHSSGSSRVRH